MRARIGEKAGAGDRAAAHRQAELGVEVAGDLAGAGVAPGLVAEGERPEAQRREVAAAERQRPRVVVAGDPDPVAAGHQRGEPGGVGGGERLAGGAVVEAVAEADDAGRGQGRDLGGEAVEGLGGLVGRQQRAAAAGEALGLAEVEVGDAEQPLGRPEERAGRAGGEAGAGEGERLSGHGPEMPERRGRRKGVCA